MKIAVVIAFSAILGLTLGGFTGGKKHGSIHDGVNGIVHKIGHGGKGVLHKIGSIHGGSHGVDSHHGLPHHGLPHHGRPHHKFFSKWGSWGSWSTCSKPCGGGRQTRTRKCVSSIHRFGGSSNRCRGGPSSQSRACNTQACAVDGVWGSWTPFGECSEPCEGGVKSRSRQCDSPAPSNGGEDCRGPSVNRMSCNNQACPINGVWSDWTPFGSCSVTCGGGRKDRSRECNNPAPANGGDDCDGSDSDSMSCNNQSCAIDGMWSNWEPYTGCSRTCGGGVRTRDRTCTNPRPSNGGADCVGEAWESGSCNNRRCPITYD